jgi:hypothetical protein
MPVLSPLLREGSDRKTVEQKIMYTFALVMCPRLEPSSHEGGYHATLPSPLSSGSMVSATGTLPGIKTG